jgi:outer membrane protein TolC
MIGAFTSMFLPFVMKNSIPSSFFLALLLPDFASAEREIRRQVSLPEAMQLAMEHSPVIAQARSSIKTQLGVELSAKAEFLPMIDARAAYSAQDPERVESFGPMATPLDQSWLAGVEISYVIYNGGGT